MAQQGAGRKLGGPGAVEKAVSSECRKFLGGAGTSLKSAAW